ncbi:uncharacterized protein [Epargyreus clarus]|uniref:uncharacterized protein n=1 Tax=Epargyreus clarus TaxID=520877 RepID=UPI003C2DEFE1
MSLNRSKSCDKKIKTIELKLLKIVNKIESLKLNNNYISRLDVQTNKKRFHFKFLEGKSKLFLWVSSIIILSALLGFWWFQLDTIKGCLLEIPSSSKALFRPPEDCSMCMGVDDVVRLANITDREFEEQYAYGTVPVIVTDATMDWKAIDHFNFDFFANFYRSNKMGRRINDCFYFAYKSGLNSLNEVFNMDQRRANLSGEPWYVGWSTCYDEETRKLREYYKRPYFLPRTSESDMVDWIFMGGPGQGAHMHVDSVRHMSWQAQVRGRKRWQLAPPPECLYRCRALAFTVLPGEILVVDTNRWYHMTSVLPGDISITIGAEYD